MEYFSMKLVLQGAFRETLGSFCKDDVRDSENVI